MDKIIRLGVIGTSNISVWVLKNVANIEGLTIDAVYSRDMNRAAEFGKMFGAKHYYNDLEAMANSDIIDAVYIASPNSYHAPQAKQFLLKDKHVLCEKAFTSNEKEADEIIDIAKKKGLILMEAMFTGHIPNFKGLKENLYKIGKIRKIFTCFCQYSSRYDKYKEGIILNAFNPKYSNGSLMDIGVYCLHPIINLFGLPNEIKANALILDSGVDGEGCIILKYDEMESIASYSKISNSYIPSEIQGEEGSIIINKINAFDKVEIIYKDGRNEDISLNQNEDLYYYELIKFVNLIKENNTSERDELLKISKDVMSVMDEARRQIGLKYIADKEF